MKKMLRRTKGQAALEFLTTYGWMIVITLIVGAALASFGVFNPERVLPEQCDLGYDFLCKQFVVYENATVRVQAVNKIGEDLEVIAFECTYEDQSTSAMSVGPNTWTAGGKMPFECPGSITLEEGLGARVEITLAYKKKSGGFTQSMTGSIQTKVVDSN